MSSEEDDEWVPNREEEVNEDPSASDEEMDDEQADELQDDLFGARLDPFTLLEGMGAQETGDDAASGLQPYEILARTARMAREREAGRSKAANEASGSEEEAPQQTKGRKKGKAVFGATVDDIWDEDLAAELGMGTTSSARKKQRERAKRRRKATAQGKRTKQLPSEVTEKVGEANLLYASGKYQEAIKLLKDVLRLAPNLSDPYHTLGRLHEAAGDTRTALDFYMLAAHLTPKDVSLWKRLATLSAQLGFVRQAIYCLSKVIIRDNHDMDARFDRAALYMDLGEPRKAAGAFEQIAAMRPGDMEVPKMLARLYHHLEEPDRATAVLERHLREHPLAADLTHINILAELYMEHGNHQAAVDLIQRAGTHMCGATGLPIDLQGEVTMQIKASMCYMHLGDMAAAAPGLKALKEEAPEAMPDLYLDAADTLLQTGHPQQALDLFQAVQRARPAAVSNVGLWTKMADCYTEQGNVKGAVRVYTQVLKDGQVPVEGRMEAAMALAELHQKRGQQAQALAAVKSLDKLGVPSLELTFRKSLLLLEMKDLEGYLDVMMPILELTIKQASGKKQRRADPANKAWRRKEIIARNKRQAKGGIFKGYERKDRRKPHVKEADEKLAELLGEEPPGEGEEEEAPEAGLRLDDIYKDPAQFEVLVQTARVLMQTGRALQALDLVTDCITHLTRRHGDKSKKEGLRLLAAEAALAAGEPAQAITHIKGASANWPHSISLWNLFSRAATSLGNMRQGQRVASLLLQAAPDSVPLRLISGHCHCLGNAYGRGVAEYMSVYNSAPEDALTLLCIAVAHLNQAFSRKVPDRDRALLAAFSFFQNYSKQRKNEQEAFYNLGRAAHHVGLVQLAVPWYQRALKAQVQQPAPTVGTCSVDLSREIAHNLALIYSSSGANELAAEVLKAHLTV